jgi:hypothetical protein
MRALRSQGRSCATWRRGVFHPCLPLPPGMLASLESHFPRVRFLLPSLPPTPWQHGTRGYGLPLCSAHASRAVADGAVDDDTGLWTPRGCRLPYRFPHALLSRCLAGKRLLVVGDSLLRQFAGRLVATIRGQPLFVEHELGHGSVYTWDVGGRRDEWMPTTQAGLLDAVAATVAAAPRLSPSAPFLLVRKSDLTLSDFDGLGALVDALRPTHIVAGTNYWLHGNASAQAPAAVAAGLLAALRPRPATAALRSALLYETPCYSAREFGSDAGLVRADWAEHGTRNGAMHNALGTLWAAGGMGGVTLGFLPNCATGRADMAARTLDNTHFGCRWHPFPDRASLTSGPITRLHATADFDCADHLDWTGVRVLLATMCPHEFGGDGERAVEE